MATLLSPQVAATIPAVGHGFAGNLKAVTGTYSLTAALAAADVLQMVKVPRGATVVDTLLVVTDLDTGGSPSITLHVGYGGDPDYFIAASTVGQAGGVARSSAVTAKPLALAVDDTIDVTVAAGPATGATTGTVSLTVFFLLP